ncbi:MAG: hypothetical protein BWX80_01426 [Candidatus Hydrogenedentes bacterium ADurb.Bin101]|nr:MAG: hypothetical protein BWX80_01426 [Candidatus Hydrogenedentes bacterium ADurb.Bin101]
MQEDFFFNAEIELGTEDAEILDGKDMTIRGFVPGVGQPGGDRGASLKSQFSAHAPVPEVGKGHDAFTPHTQHFLQGQGRVLDYLQGHAQNDIIEGIIRQFRKAPINIGVNDIDAAADGPDHLFLVHLDAEADDVPAPLQAAEKVSLAAAHIKDTAAFIHQAHNHIVVDAARPGQGTFPVGIGYGRVLAVAGFGRAIVTGAFRVKGMDEKS